MSRIKTIFFFALLLYILNPAHAGRPLTVDDADPAGPGSVEIETGLGYAYDSGNKSWELPVGLAFGASPGIELGLGFGGLYEDRDDVDESGVTSKFEEESFDDITIGAKWQLPLACPLGARHAIAPSVKLPAADDDKGFGSGKIDFDLTWILTRPLGDQANLHLNAGYSWIGGADKDIVHYGFALDYQLTESLQWVGEIYAEDERSSEANTAFAGNTGFRLTAGDLTFDIAGGARIDGDIPDFFTTIGLTWALGGLND